MADLTSFERLLVTLCAVIAPAIVLLPLIARASVRGYLLWTELFEPVWFIFISVVLGVTARTIWLISSDDKAAVFRLTDGVSTVYLLPAMLLLITGLGALAFGYIVGTRGRFVFPFDQEFRYAVWNESRLLLVVGVLLVLSITAFLIQLQLAGVDQLGMDNISEKRGLRDESGARIGGYSYLLWAINLCAPALLLSTAYVVTHRPGTLSLATAAVICSALTLTAVGFLASRRGLVIDTVISATVIWLYVEMRRRGWRRVRVGRAALVLLGLIGFFLATTAFRYGASNFADVQAEFGLLQPLVRVAESGNLGGIDKPLVALARIPEKANWLYGQSLVEWIVRPIPRGLWPDKPEALGYRFVAEVYGRLNQHGQSVTGYPPGALVEFYWNFGILGAVLGMSALGVIAATVYRSFHYDMWRGSISILVIYSVIFRRIGAGFIDQDVSSNITKMLMEIIPLIACIWWIAGERRRRQRQVQAWYGTDAYAPAPTQRLEANKTKVETGDALVRYNEQ